MRRPRTVLAIASLLGLVAIVLLAGAHSTPYRQCNDAYVAHYGPAQTVNLHKSIGADHQFPVFLECEETFLNANSGTFLFVVTCLLAGVAFQQYRTTRAQLRAYILPESGSLFDGTTNNPPIPECAGEPAVTLLFRNSGQTPAFRYISWAQITVGEITKADTLTIPPLKNVFPATVGASGVMPKTLRLGRKLIQEEIDDILHAKKAIFVYGRIEYLDAFHSKRWSNFRLYYVGPYPAPKGALLLFSEQGNEAN